MTVGVDVRASSIMDRGVILMLPGGTNGAVDVYIPAIQCSIYKYHIESTGSMRVVMCT